MSESPLISVIVPVYNGERFLRDAIDSILAQDYGRLQILVIDDGSTDTTPAIASEFRSRIDYHRQENQGPAVARNNGLSMARGEIVTFLDADDLWCANKLASQLPLLSNPEVSMVWGRTQLFTLNHGAGSAFLPYREPGHFTQLGSLLLRKSVFEVLGQFAPELRITDDLDFLARIEESGTNVLRHDEIVLNWRRHEDNITKDNTQTRKGFVAALKRSLDRKRNAQNVETRLEVAGD